MMKFGRRRQRSSRLPKPGIGSDAKILAFCRTQQPEAAITNVHRRTKLSKAGSRLDGCSVDESSPALDRGNRTKLVLRGKKKLNVSYEDTYVLNCQGGTMGIPAWKAFRKTLSECQRTRSLEFHDMHLGMHGYQAVAGILKTNKMLRELRFCYCSDGIPTGGLLHLVQAIRDWNTTLVRLDLVGCKLDTDGWKALATLIHSNQSLEQLHLKSTRGGDSFLESRAAGVELVQALSNNHTLTHLSLPDQMDSQKVHLALARALESNCTLQSLELSCSNRMAPEAWKALAKGLALNSSLMHLGVRASRPVGFPGWMALQTIIGVNKTLRSLTLTLAFTEATGWTVLADALAINTYVQHLSLIQSHIDQSGWERLAKALVVGTTLSSINVSGISLIGWTAFANGLAANRSVEHLNLSQCRMDALAWESLVAALCENMTLQFIDFTGVNGVDEFYETVLSYLSLNQAGRKRLLRLKDDVAPGTDWIEALIYVRNDVRALFYLISAKPDVCKRPNQ